MKNKIIIAVLFIAGVLLPISAISSTSSKIPDEIVLTKENHVLLRGEVNGDSVQKVIEQFAELLNKRGSKNLPMYLVLDTPGGSVSDGYRLHEFLKGYKNIHTITINSYSMGAILAELVAGNRLMIETGVLMFHRMRANLPYPVTTEQLHSRTRFYEQMEKFAMQKTAERVGISVEELFKLCDEELYMDGNEAVKRNFIDKVVTVKCSPALIKQKITQIVQPLPFLPPMEVEVSACPLL